MKLKKYTDYALRVLIFVGSKEQDQLSSVKEISAVFFISENHLSKIVFQLSKLGLVETIRGRNGGIRLAKQPNDIYIGDVVRYMEDDFNIMECFEEGTNHCVISPSCRLKNILNQALVGFLQILDQYTLEDLLVNKDALVNLMKRE